MIWCFHKSVLTQFRKELIIIKVVDQHIHFYLSPPVRLGSWRPSVCQRKELVELTAVLLLWTFSRSRMPRCVYLFLSSSLVLLFRCSVTPFLLRIQTDWNHERVVKSSVVFQKAFSVLCHSTHLYGRRLVLEWADAGESVEELRRKTAQHFHGKATLIYSY